MSLVEHNRAPSPPVTALAWTSSSSTCPKDFSMITVTHDGAVANFVRGTFAMKSGYYLCLSTNPSLGHVIANMQIIPEKGALPPGYSYIPEYMDHKTTVCKKKRLCVRLVPLGCVETAVLDVKITAKNKMVLPHYTCLGDMNGYVIWCKTGHVTSPAPQAKPRRISLDMQNLSLEQPSPPLPLRPSNGPPPPPVGKMSRRRSNLQIKDPTESVCDGSTSSTSAMDGVPFVLHPKFESKSNGVVQPNTLKDIRIKSVQEIENEYNYTFAVEETAANRSQRS